MHFRDQKVAQIRTIKTHWSGSCQTPPQPSTGHDSIIGSALTTSIRLYMCICPQSFSWSNDKWQHHISRAIPTNTARGSISIWAPRPFDVLYHQRGDQLVLRDRRALPHWLSLRAPQPINTREPGCVKALWLVSWQPGQKRENWGSLSRRPDCARDLKIYSTRNAGACLQSQVTVLFSITGSTSFSLRCCLLRL